LSGAGGASGGPDRGRPPVSGVVICFNEEETIGRCLASLSWCEEIVVVDSNSTDRTVEIARQYTPRVIEQAFLGYVKQKNFALDQATHDWVVCLDADEALSEELQAEVAEAITEADDTVSGFVLDRMTYFLGVWHDRGEWYPDPQLRVFRRSRGHWVGLDPHDRIELRGPARPLAGRLLHWNYRDLSEHVQTIDRFSAHLAREMREHGRRFRLWDLVLRPPGRFVKGYLLRQGFRKGLPGFLVSASTAYYVFMKYAKLWEIERSERE
jgi:glycosyltransferase involved in cell wall biosynthesis